MLNIPLNVFILKIKTHASYLLMGCCIWLTLFQDKFTGIFTIRTFTGWDSHSYGFVYFLYFSDALKNGSIPIWNPFIQSGNFFPNFFNAGLFYPFELIFVVLGWLIGPLLSFELMIQVAIFLGGLGTYLLLRHWQIQPFLALIGSCLYALIVLSPVVGQIWYTISFSSLPWLLYICTYLSEQKKKVSTLQWMFWGMAYTFFVSGGYLWLNLMNLLLVFSFIFLKQLNSKAQHSKVLSKLFYWLCQPPFLFLFFVSFIYACMVLPCFLNLEFNYREFLGDFASPDGRLRGLRLLGETAGHGGLLETLIGNLDPLISQNQPWWKEGAFTYGGGWTLWIAFVVCLATKWSKRQLYWLALLLLAITYSAGSNTILGSILTQIPVINGNRYWLGVGTSFASIFLLFITIEKLDRVLRSTSNTEVLLVRTGLILLLSTAFLIYMYAPPIEFVMAVSSCLLVGIFFKYQLRLAGKIALVTLVALNVFYILNSPYRAYSNPPLEDKYLDLINNRKEDITASENHRKLATGTELNYYDTEWIYQKIPFSHGYNHLGNPQYWYVKNNPFLEKIILATQMARPALKTPRLELSSDNEFAQKVAADILSRPLIPTIEPDRYSPIIGSAKFQYQISNLRLNPNSVQFDINMNEPAHVILNMLYAPGWGLLVDGVEQKQYRANYIFQGIDILAPGKHQVNFLYRPYIEIFLLAMPYMIFLLLTVIGLFKINKLNLSGYK